MKKAAFLILLCNTAVQIMQSFNGSFHLAESAETSILAAIARPFAYLLVPVVGVLSWQLAAASVTGFIAKENVVGTLITTGAFGKGFLPGLIAVALMASVVAWLIHKANRTTDEEYKHEARA